MTKEIERKKARDSGTECVCYRERKRRNSASSFYSARDEIECVI